MSNTEQKILEEEVAKIVAEHGEQGAVRVIKDMPADGIFASMANYPAGVFIYCNSEKGGVLVGTKK